MQSNNAAAKGRFAAAAFANQSQRFTGLDTEADILNSLDRLLIPPKYTACPDRKFLGQVANFE